MRTNSVTAGLQLWLLLPLGMLFAGTSFGGIILNAGCTGFQTIVTANDVSCGGISSGTDGSVSATWVAGTSAYASGTYGGLHASADASFDLPSAPTVVNGEGVGASASAESQDTFSPSVGSGILEYQLSLDGSLTQLVTPNCTDCSSYLDVLVSTTGLAHNVDQSVLTLSGNLGLTSQTLTVDIPYSAGNGGFTVSLELIAGAQAMGFPASSVDWVDTADFQDTLDVLGVGIVGAPGAALNPTSGYEYPALNSTPEPSTFFLALGVIGTCFLASVYRVAVRKSDEEDCCTTQPFEQVTN